MDKVIREKDIFIRNLELELQAIQDDKDQLIKENDVLNSRLSASAILKEDNKGFKTVKLGKRKIENRHSIIIIT
eukprot:UN17163